MANSKIADLTALGSAPAAGDLFLLTDVSDTSDHATGTNKKITYTNLISGLATSGANSSITSLTGLTTPLSVAQGGSGAATLTGILKGNGTSAFTAVTAPSGTIVGTTDTQTLTNKTLTAPIIATITNGAGTLTLPSVNTTLIGDDTTHTLTNKRITARVNTTADTGSLTINGDTTDMYTVTALAQALTINAPSGTPTNGQKLVIRILDNGTARALTWNAIFAAIGVTLPTTTVISKYLYVGCIYNTTATKWDVLAVQVQA